MDIIKARKASAKAQAGSSSIQVKPKSITPDSALRPSSMPLSEAAYANSALGK